MNPYELALALIGVALLGAVWLARLLKRHPLTFPIVFVALGAGLYLLPLPLPPASPLGYGVVAEHLTELAVIVALAGAGLRIDTVFGAKRWSLTWRLLGMTMPLSIVAGAWLGHVLLGHGLAAAVLLGSVLAPTDPVLASDVQVYGPGEGAKILFVSRSPQKQASMMAWLFRLCGWLLLFRFLGFQPLIFPHGSPSMCSGAFSGASGLVPCLATRSCS